MDLKVALISTNINVSRCRFNLSINSKELAMYDIKKLSELNRIQLNKLSICGNCEIPVDELNQAIYQLLQLKPKYISFDFPLQSHRTDFNLSGIFSDNFIKSIKIDDTGLVEPFEVSNINNQFTKLSSISIFCLFHKLMRIYNSNGNSSDSGSGSGSGSDSSGSSGSSSSGSSSSGSSGSGDSLNYEIDDIADCESNFVDMGLLSHPPEVIKQHYQLMVEILSNNTTFKRLSINNYCVFLNCKTRRDLDPSIIINCFAGILNNPKSNIETLIISTSELSDNLKFLSVLESNKSIKHLRLSGVNPTLLIERVLPSNKTIKHLTIEFYRNEIFSSIVQTLSNVIPSSSLYSISLVFYTYLPNNYPLQDHISQFISTLCSNPTTPITIKEFNIFIKHLYDYRSNKKNQNNRNNNDIKQILNNNINTIFSVSHFTIKL